MVKCFNFHNSSFALMILLNVKWQGHGVTHTLLRRGLIPHIIDSMLVSIGCIFNWVGGI
jgi:hypothetical protein